MNDKKAMARMEYTIALYPKIGFRQWTDSTSETSPIAGRIMI